MAHKNRSFVQIALLLPLLAPQSLTLLAGGCTSAGVSVDVDHDEHLSSANGALTAAQCLYFDVNGKDTICHRTGSAAHPYTIVKTSEQGCINGHVGHAHDYIAVGDPTCQGGGCLPANAPCDATLPCCDGTTCQSGTCQVTDPCGVQPCENEGTCTATGSTTYHCACPAGWTGANCDIDIDECASNPCQNGDCADQVNGYACYCGPGWTGANCDIDIDECASNPCQNGDCADQVNGYACYCGPGWTGANCDINIDECESDPCQNGDCADHVNSYTCDCNPGWTGANCDIDIDECESDPCQNGDCADHVNSYTCDCNPGWGGTNCDVASPG